MMCSLVCSLLRIMYNVFIDFHESCRYALGYHCQTLGPERRKLHLCIRCLERHGPRTPAMSCQQVARSTTLVYPCNILGYRTPDDAMWAQAAQQVCGSSNELMIMCIED